jgi:hypothetical protein
LMPSKRFFWRCEMKQPPRPSAADHNSTIAADWTQVPETSDGLLEQPAGAGLDSLPSGDDANT